MNDGFVSSSIQVSSGCHKSNFDIALQLFFFSRQRINLIVINFQNNVVTVFLVDSIDFTFFGQLLRLLSHFLFIKVDLFLTHAVKLLHRINGSLLSRS